jgi:hypothetical protein
MREIIGLGLAAVFATVTSMPARSDAVATVDPKAAAEFVLKTCLPAMDDLANVEMIARENNWLLLPYPARSWSRRDRDGGQTTFL